jgi:hypothetical protein
MNINYSFGSRVVKLENKNQLFVWHLQKNSLPLHPLIKYKLGIDPLAQLVEHNTFNVGVMGSSPMRITSEREDFNNEILFFRLYTPLVS